MRARQLLGAFLLAALPLVAACDFGIRLSGSPPTAKGTTPTARPKSTGAVALDPIGDKPVLGAPKPFEPAPPQVFQTASGLTV